MTKYKNCILLCLLFYLLFRMFYCIYQS
uniref:Uncharacterized protein n=1 Tax=Anguilla anguilla TaxID=7936 RepID=A0A0E9U081_ANGAN